MRHCHLIALGAAFLAASSGWALSHEESIHLNPKQGTMEVEATVPNFDGATVLLGIPETIGCREMMILNWVEVENKIEWTTASDGSVSCAWWPGGRVRYDLTLRPAADHVDIEMIIHNDTDLTWHDVWSFNCINPEAPVFDDPGLERTFFSSDGHPIALSQARGVPGPMATYVHDQVPPGFERRFIHGTEARQSKSTDSGWIAVESEPAGYCLATATLDALYLFNNTDLACIHAAPDFGDIAPGASAARVARVYFLLGSLDDFRERLARDRAELKARQEALEP